MTGDVPPVVQSLAPIAVGGVAGALARHAVAGVLPPLPATLLVNVAGAFALGLLLYGEIQGASLSREVRLLVATGFVSSLTTYSTFAVQTVGASPAVAAANVAGTYALGFAAVAAGRGAAVRIGSDGGDDAGEVKDDGGSDRDEADGAGPTNGDVGSETDDGPPLGDDERGERQ